MVVGVVVGCSWFCGVVGDTMKKKSGPSVTIDVSGGEDELPPPPRYVPPPPAYPGPPAAEVKTRKTDLLRWHQRLVQRVMLHRKKSRKILVEMNLAQGGVLHFIAYVKGRSFLWRGSTYVVDESAGKYNFNQRMFMHRYHEHFALPVQWSVSAEELVDAAGEQAADIRTSFNPGVLRDVLKFEYAKAVIRGAEVSAMIKRVFFLAIIIAAAVLLHFGVAAYKGGWIG